MTNADLIAGWRKDHPGERLTEATLRALIGTDLQGADLRSANLRVANLRYADLRSANLQGADLRSANLWGANLRYADLRVANLWSTDLWGYFPIQTPSGPGYCAPTPDGLRLTIGCWDERSLDDLRALLADEAEWPNAVGEERERRRPFLAAVLAQAEATEAYYADYLAELREKWGETND
ncbi:pentapeptide repeat-containing protein [Sediminivirga luteola]|uniref:Pentapeptide repeat-containing protein n=1 Tax=Sediminivirga luteola TaxID=1774748 RepID=A0A8J2TX90_9MICO|nr:pentapeptide repeat-containing protein [Sediminivirga luteola]GGA10857.1 hypothetical protein GCM10011333_12100 [Sediminivirga luteola]